MNSYGKSHIAEVGDVERLCCDVMTLLIGIGIIGLSMRSPYGVYILMDFLVFFLLTYAVWHYIVKKNNYFGAYRLLQKGERYPVAYQKDETGKIIFSWETAKETMNDVLRIFSPFTSFFVLSNHDFTFPSFLYFLSIFSIVKRSSMRLVDLPMYVAG